MTLRTLLRGPDVHGAEGPRRTVGKPGGNRCQLGRCATGGSQCQPCGNASWDLRHVNQVMPLLPPSSPPPSPPLPRLPPPLHPPASPRLLRVGRSPCISLNLVMKSTGVASPTEKFFQTSVNLMCASCLIWNSTGHLVFFSQVGLFVFDFTASSVIFFTVSCSSGFLATV